TVLLPKLSYRSQTTPLHTKMCQQIASPFNLMFKKRMNLPSTFPSISLHSPNLFNIIKLSSFLQTEQLSTLYKLLNNSKFSPLYLARLKNLQYTLCLLFFP